MDKGYSHALAAALIGDDVFLDAINKAEPDSYGINCSVCETYYVGSFKTLPPEKSCCPNCQSTMGSFESPALGIGPAAGYNHKGK